MEITLIAEENQVYFEPICPLMLQGTISFGLIHEGEPCGCLQFSFIGNSAELRYIFICPDFRRMGGGRKLLTESIVLLKGSGIEKVFCLPTYLDYSIESYWDTFLRDCGFVEEAIDGYKFSFPLAHMVERTEIHMGKEVAPLPKNIVPLTHFPKEKWVQVIDTIKDEEARLRGQDVIASTDFVPELTFVVANSQGISAYLMINRIDETEYEISGLYNEGNNPSVLSTLISATILHGAELCPQETTVSAIIYYDKLIKTVKKMLDNYCYSQIPIHRFVFSFK